MRIEIIVPRLGWSMEEGAFVAWLKKDGEWVQAGEPLLSIEGDKAVQEIESIDSGILRIAGNGPKPGDSIRVGDVLGHLVSADDAATEPATARPTTTSASAAEAPILERGAPSPLPSPPLGAGERVPEGRERGNIPAISPRALRVAGELGVDWTKVNGTGRTGRIRERDIRVAAVSSRASGSLSPAEGERGPTLVTGQNRTVLVTGGGGFIGTWVVRELLERKLGVVVLDANPRPLRWPRVIGTRSESVPFIEGGLLDRALLARIFAEHQVTHVIHLAALLTPACQSDPWEGCRVNVLGSVALFEQVRLSPHRVQGFSYASSVAVFGEEPDQVLGPEESVNRPPTFYGAFKKSLELIAGQYWRHYQIASMGVRPQVAYGPEREVGLTAGPSLAARAAAQDEPYCIGYTGRVGYDYVEDVASAFVRGAVETPADALIVDLPGEVADVKQVIAAIAAAAPEAAAKLSVSGPLIPAHTPPTRRCISSVYPDWKTTSLAEGLRRTVEFYRGQPKRKSTIKTGG